MCIRYLRHPNPACLCCILLHHSFPRCYHHYGEVRRNLWYNVLSRLLIIIITLQTLTFSGYDVHIIMPTCTSTKRSYQLSLTSIDLLGTFRASMHPFFVSVYVLVSLPLLQVVFVFYLHCLSEYKNCFLLDYIQSITAPAAPTYLHYLY